VNRAQSSNNPDPFFAGNEGNKQRVMLDKEKRRKEEEEKQLRQLDQIRQDNVQRRQDAQNKQIAQYRTSKQSYPSDSTEQISMLTPGVVMMSKGGSH
jgi:hypothetical protein